jgi:hypothetical protein
VWYALMRCSERRTSSRSSKGEDIAAMDAVIDQIAELPGVLDTESKVARWID